MKMTKLFNEYCGSRRGKHASVSLDREMNFGKTPRWNAKMTFDHIGRFTPKRLQSGPKSTFFSYCKTQIVQTQNPKTISLAQSNTKIWVLM